jgi:hypothetical protein
MTRHGIRLVTCMRTLPILSLLALTLLPGCLSYREVALRGVEDVQVERLDRKGIAVQVLATIENPNGYRIQVKDPDVDLYLDGTFVGKATLDTTVTLDKRCTRTYTVPLHADLSTGGAPAMMVLLGAALKGDVLLGANGSVVGKAFLVSKRFPFEIEQRIDL